ncbi:unnamed protein product [Brassicogethes aeneus]|uniref:Uncharacterized protein n=1 Tax=Brassicogethes aeneus TaxID=1431903 RepID=A0A9P0FJD6_BRAAE|nr:unnamed protein product [Brassicogethes aeneus]
MPKTKDWRCHVFGEPQKLSEKMLPTYNDITKYYLLVRNDFPELNGGKDPAIKDVCKIISSDIEKIWNKSLIPIPSTSCGEVDFILQQVQGREKLRNDVKKLFCDESKNLFDIATCKSDSKNLCKCAVKFPVTENHFLKDQREDRRSKSLLRKIDEKRK